MKKILLLLSLLALVLVIAGCPQPGESVIGSDSEGSVESEDADDRSALAGNAKATPKKPLQQSKPAAVNNPCQGKADGFVVLACADVRTTKTVCKNGRTQTLDCDRDSDSVFDRRDNCPNIANPQQRDVDGDGIGNHCDEDTVVLQGCDQLQEGKTYVLESDLDVEPRPLSICLRTPDHIIIDCQGHEIMGTEPRGDRNRGTAIGNQDGSVLDGSAHNITIRNCIIGRFASGIQIVAGLDIRNPRDFGTDINVHDVILRDNGRAATFSQISNFLLEQVDLEDNTYPLQLSSVSGTVRDIRSPSNDGPLSISASSDLRVERITFCGTFSGLVPEVSCSSDSTVRGNGNVFDTTNENACAWAQDPTTHSPCPQ